MTTLRIPELLELLVDAQVDEAAAKVLGGRVRTALEDVARRRYAEEGAAPSWTARGRGAIRYEAPGEWAPTVTDPDALASWVAERHPTEAVATITLPAARLEDALAALEFAGVPVDTSTLAVRPAYLTTLLERLTVDVTDEKDGTRTTTVQDVDAHGVATLVPGVNATRSVGKLVVTPERDYRRDRIDAAVEAIDSRVAALTGGPDPAAVALRATELLALKADELAALAREHDLSASGTKAAQAERIARAELAAQADTTARPPRTNAEAAAILKAAGERILSAVRPPATLEAPDSTPLEEWPDPAAKAGGDDASTDDEPRLGDVVDGPAKAVAAQLPTKLDDLKREARARGLSVGGTKAVLTERIVNHELRRQLEAITDDELAEHTASVTA